VQAGRHRDLQGDHLLAARHALRLPTPQCSRRQREQPLCGGVRRGPISRVVGREAHMQLGLLQLVLLLQQRVDVAGCDPRTHQCHIRPRQRRIRAWQPWIPPRKGAWRERCAHRPPPPPPRSNSARPLPSPGPSTSLMLRREGEPRCRHSR
jgi:hypothetical protein